MSYRVNLKSLTSEHEVDVNQIRIVIHNNDDFEEVLKDSSPNYIYEIKNTRGITSDMIDCVPDNVVIRVAGGYDDERIEAYKNCLYEGKLGGVDYYFRPALYSKNELKSILKEMEKIEEKMNPEWNDLEKALYIYDILKRTVMYDKKINDYDEDSNLSGFISKKSICAGFALMYKEMLDRQGIDCHFCCGNGHAWNVIKLGDKLYPIDVTWENNNFTKGNIDFVQYFANARSFSVKHVLNPHEPFKYREEELSSVDLDILKQACKNIINIRRNGYTLRTYKRDDGSEFFLAQVSSSVVNGSPVYKYIYANRLPQYDSREDYTGNDELVNPRFYISRTSLASIYDKIGFSKKTSLDEKRDAIVMLDSCIANQLFSEDAVEEYNAPYNFNGYINSLIKDEMGNYLVEHNDLENDYSKLSTCIHLKRPDGSTTIVEKPYSQIEDQKVNKYVLYDISDKEIVSKTVYTEADLFDANNSLLLDPDRLDRTINKYNGYIGYIEGGKIKYDEDVIKLFKRGNFTENTDTSTWSFPSLSELQLFSSKCSVYYENGDVECAYVVDKSTHQLEKDAYCANCAILADMWKSSGRDFSSPASQLEYKFISGQGIDLDSTSEFFSFLLYYNKPPTDQATVNMAKFMNNFYHKCNLPEPKKTSIS